MDVRERMAITPNERPILLCAKKAFLRALQKRSEFRSRTFLQDAKILTSEDRKQCGAVFGQFSGHEFGWQARQSEPKTSLSCVNISSVIRITQFHHLNQSPQRLQRNITSIKTHLHNPTPRRPYPTAPPSKPSLPSPATIASLTRNWHYPERRLCQYSAPARGGT